MSGHRAVRARVSPAAQQFAELFVAARSRRATKPRRPGPYDQSVGHHVVGDRGDVAIAVARGVFELLADLSQRAAFPGHGSRCEMPVIVAGNSCRIEVVRLMASTALHAGRTVAVSAAYHERQMKPSAVGLPRAVGGRMAIHAPRMLQHLTGLFEQSNRPRALIRDAPETRCRAQLLRCNKLRD